MPVRDLPYDVLLSDLVLNEIDPMVGYSRQDINIAPPADDAPVVMGTVVFKSKDTSYKDPYTVITPALASSVLVSTNEFAVVFGNHYQCKSEFVPLPIEAGKWNAVAFVRGQVQLKDKQLKEANAGLTETDYELLTTLLQAQGVLVAPVYPKQ